MDYNKGIRGSFGGSVFILFAIGVAALILLTLIAFCLDPPSAHGDYIEDWEIFYNKVTSYDPNYNIDNDPNVIAMLNDMTDNLAETVEQLNEEEKSYEDSGCFIDSVVGDI